MVLAYLLSISFQIKVQSIIPRKVFGQSLITSQLFNHSQPLRPSFRFAWAARQIGLVFKFNDSVTS